jgi:hypothetical protein
MTSVALIQRAAELVIEFGLEHAGMTAGDVREEGLRADRMMLTWRPPCPRGGHPAVELVVLRQTASMSARVNVEAVGLSPSDARRVHELYGRVIDLAARIEALR